VKIRPPRPPIYEKEAEDIDQFHPVIRSSSPLLLPDHVVEFFSEAKSQVTEHINRSPVNNMPGDNVIVVTLGTGSAVPTKYRNSPCL
jgi:ribonuclease Z